MSDQLVKFHLQRLDALRGDRSGWDAQWEEAAARIVPAHRDTFSSRGANANSLQGQKKTEYQFDATPGLACQKFASVMESLSTPQSARWHRLVPSDYTLRRNRQVREYFDQINEILFSYRYRPAANFVANTQQAYLSLGAYGNGIVFVDAPDDTPGLRYRGVHLAETYFVQNHANVVDTVYRAFWMPARSIAQAFPDAPEEIRRAAASANESERKFELVHVVLPRGDFTPGALDERGKRFASLYFCRQPLMLLSKGGFNEFPYAITRYTQAPGEIYGRGPAQWVLPSIKLLNEQKKVVLKQGHRTVDPVLLAYDDGSIDGFSLRAGAINKGGMTAEGKPLVGVLPTGRVDVGDKLMEMERSVINDAFLISLFQILIDTPQMTATEVIERAREKGILIAPIAGRMQTEFLGPLIQRELELLERQQLLPPPPPILIQAGAEYKIEYDSPMSRMQRAERASGFTRTIQTVAEYVKMTGDPTPLDHFNFDAAIPELLDINGAPVSWTRSEDEVKALRDQRAQQQEQQQMVEAAPAVAQVMKAMPKGAQPGATPVA